MTAEFDGRIVAVTGAAHGIGRAIALGFAASGARVALIDRDEAALEETAAAARASGPAALVVRADLLAAAQIADGFARIARELGDPDVLVNNVGQTARENFSEFHLARPETLDFVLDISLRTTIHCSRQVVPAMRARRSGKIVSIASDSAFNGDIGTADYAAAKSGVLGFTRALARELGPHKINVNAVCPGPTNTRAMQRIPRDAYERAKAMVPMGELCEPEDIAHAVLFLASARARFITGQTLLVNGGRVFH